MTFSLWAWIILGQENKRKSSLMRNLTGLGRSRDFDVTLANGQRLRLWTQFRSLNEAGLEPKGWVESCFHDAESDLRSRYNMLIALRLDFGKHGYEAEDYIRELVRAEAHIESIVTLGEPTRSWVPDCGVPYCDVPDVSVPTNQIGETVRQLWGWR